MNAMFDFGKNQKKAQIFLFIFISIFSLHFDAKSHWNVQNKQRIIVWCQQQQKLVVKFVINC